MERPITSDYLNARENSNLVFANILEKYLQPSFGSISKRDIDIAMFMTMQDLELIGKNPTIYDVVTSLHITRSKARSLIYESALRRAQNEYDVDDELKKALCKLVFLSGNDKMIGIELDNPLLIDHLKYKLRKLGHLTDGAFNQDMVKLTVDALAALYEEYMPANRKEYMKQVMREAGVEEDDKLKTMLSSLFGTLKEKSVEKGIDIVLEKLPMIIKGIITTAQLAFVLA